MDKSVGKREPSRKPVLCVDFDGTIHQPRLWRGPGTKMGDLVPGALEFLEEAQEHFRVAVYSCRSARPGAVSEMRNWLGRAAIQRGKTDLGPYRWIEWPKSKPPAHAYLDDRGVTFTGVWPSFDDLLAFRPWNAVA
jgi:hypothetical protein